MIVPIGAELVMLHLFIFMGGALIYFNVIRPLLDFGNEYEVIVKKRR